MLQQIGASSHLWTSSLCGVWLVHCPQGDQSGRRQHPPSENPLHWFESSYSVWRIIKRTVTFIFLSLQNKVQQFKESQPQRKNQTKQFVRGLTDRLSALEESIPTSAETRSWMTLEDAFKVLGGDPKNPKSVITTLNGQGSLSFSRFCMLRSEGEFRAFGLECNWGRRQAKQPWLRQLS